MNRACFSKNTNLHEQNQYASCIRPLKNNFIRMKRISIIILTFCYIILTINTSCQCSRKKNNIGTKEVTPEKTEVKIHIERLEKDLFSMNMDSIDQNVPKLKAKYGEFFDMFNYKIVKLGSPKDVRYANGMKKFLTDYFMSLNYNKVTTTFPNLDQLSADLGKAFTSYKNYFPDKRIPRVFTCISGWNQSVINSDTILGICLDKYLGRNCEFYDQLQLDKYMRYTMQKEYIVSDCMRLWGYASFNFNDSASTLLSNMLYEGKIWYYMKKIMPDTPDSIIFGYSPSQLKWCYNNEKQMWTYLLEHKLLFTTDYMTVRKLIYPAPFTIYFTNESPGRAVVWLGYKIIEAYMKNSDLTLPQLMAESDYQKILRKSNFKP